MFDDLDEQIELEIDDEDDDYLATQEVAEKKPKRKTFMEVMLLNRHIYPLLVPNFCLFVIQFFLLNVDFSLIFSSQSTSTC